MTFDFVNNIIIPLLIGGGASSVVLFIGKNWLAKSIDHSFDKKIEDYKSVLGRENISYQIEKSEFAKKKFEQVTQLYLLILERKRRNEDGFSLISVNTLPAVRKIYLDNVDFDRRLDESITIASLFLDDELLKTIREYKLLCHFVFIDLIEMAENRILEKRPSQLIYIKHRTVRRSGKYNSTEVINHLNEKSKLSGEKFEEINKGLKKFLEP